MPCEISVQDFLKCFWIISHCIVNLQGFFIYEESRIFKMVKYNFLCLIIKYDLNNWNFKKNMLNQAIISNICNLENTNKYIYFPSYI